MKESVGMQIKNNDHMHTFNICTLHYNFSR